MIVSLNQIEGDILVAVLGIQGELDASGFRDVMHHAELALNEGARYLLVDMTELTFMSSSGLAALHSLTLMMQNVQPQEPSDRSEAAPEKTSNARGAKQKRVILLNPQPPVMKVLESTGFSEMYEIFDDQDAALASIGLSSS